MFLTDNKKERFTLPHTHAIWVALTLTVYSHYCTGCDRGHTEVRWQRPSREGQESTCLLQS